MFFLLPKDVFQDIVKVYRFYIDVNQEVVRRSTDFSISAYHMNEAVQAAAMLRQIEAAANFVVSLKPNLPEEPQA